MSVVSTPVPSTDRRFELEARDGPALCARLRGRRPIPGLLIADAIELGVGCAPAASHEAFARAFAAACAAEGPAGDGRGFGTVLVVETPESLAWRDALREAGLREERRKVFVERRLDDALPFEGGAALADWRLRSLADAGEDAFRARLADVAEGDPFEERPNDDAGATRHLERAWRALVESAGRRFDPTRWWLVDDLRGAVGIILPQRVNESTGTLYYVGVVPGRRREGLGRRLHAAGLERLARDGASRYVGSTDVRNVAMRSVFARNGAREAGTEAYFRANPAEG